MLKTTIKITTLFLAITMLTLVSHKLVSAGSNNHTLYQPNFLSGVTATANISAEKSGTSFVSGLCYVTSSTSSFTTINVIGWSFAHCRKYNTSNQITGFDDVTPRGSSGYSATNNPYDDGGIVSMSGADYKVELVAVHDFNHTGSNPSPWTPDHTVSYDGPSN